MFEQKQWSKFRRNLQTGNGNVNNSLLVCSFLLDHRKKNTWDVMKVFQLNL